MPQSPSLPPELWRSICRHLQPILPDIGPEPSLLVELKARYRPAPRSSWKDLGSLLLTSKAMHSAAAPFYYALAFFASLPPLLTWLSTPTEHDRYITHLIVHAGVPLAGSAWVERPLPILRYIDLGGLQDAPEWISSLGSSPVQTLKGIATTLENIGEVERLLRLVAPTLVRLYLFEHGDVSEHAIPHPPILLPALKHLTLAMGDPVPPSITPSDFGQTFDTPLESYVWAGLSMPLVSSLLFGLDRAIDREDLTTTVNTARPSVLRQLDQVMDHEFWLTLASHADLAEHCSALRLGIAVFPTLIEEVYLPHHPIAFEPIPTVQELVVVQLLSFCTYEGEDERDELYVPGPVAQNVLTRYLGRETFPNLRRVLWITEEVELPVWAFWTRHAEILSAAGVEVVYL